jgi:hypothetical protein
VNNWDEARVESLCAARNMQPKRSTPREDSILHIDYTVLLDGKRVGIDVKGARRIRRTDPAPSQWYTWLELRNRNGLRGSLFGHAEYLVIASPRGWLWVRRSTLAAECTLRYIEQHGRVEEGTAWYSKHRGHSVIILVPYTYLYTQALLTWADPALNTRYYAQTE